MSVAWRAGVPDKLRLEGYVRTPEDIVARDRVDTGPDLRKLAWPTPYQKLQGRLGLKPATAALFEDWYESDLDHGSELFDFVLRDHPAPRTVIARFTRPPQLTHGTATSQLYALDLQISAPQPQTSALAALAALEGEGPAAWHPDVPGIPRRADYASAPADRVLRGNEAGPMTSRLSTRQTGREEQVSLPPLTAAQLQTFEEWFAGTAAYGARDIAFPRAGGTHLGCFTSGYTVTGSTSFAAFIVTFTRYLEAIA